MKVMRLEPEYLTQAAEIEKLCFGEDAWSEKALGDALKDKNALYICVADGERLLGYAGAWISFEDADVMNVAVDPKMRRMGIASACLKELMEQLKARGVVNYTLEVRESNLPAIGLYENLGFVLEGIRKNFYDHPRENALIYWKREG